MESVVIPSLTSSLCTICPSPDDIQKLRRFHYRALACIYKDTDIVDWWGRVSKISYGELLQWTMAQDMESQLRVLRVNLAGRIARSSANHPLRGLPTDDWDELVAKDLAILNAHTTVLKDRYQCKKLLERRNPYAH